MKNLRYVEPTITLTPLNDAAKSLASESLTIPPLDARVAVIAGKPRLTYSFQVIDADADRKLAMALDLRRRRDLRVSIWELAFSASKWRVTPMFVGVEQIETLWVHSRTIDFQIVLTKEEPERCWKDIDERPRQRRIDREPAL